MNHPSIRYLLRPEHVCMLAATIHSGNPSMTVKDSVRTAIDLIYEADRACQQEDAKHPATQAPQERQT